MRQSKALYTTTYHSMHWVLAGCFAFVVIQGWRLEGNGERRRRICLFPSRAEKISDETCAMQHFV